MKLVLTKLIKNDKYVIGFNGMTGFEFTQGINDNPDPFVLDSPSMIDIGVMGHCSNNCDICYQGNINIPNMKLEDFKLIIDQCKDHITQVALGGKGDPNKHENFKEILEHCRENNVIPNYTTSGNQLTDEEVEISKLTGAVAVSNYNKDFTYLALKKFMDNNIKTNIHFVVSKRSFEDSINILKGEDIWNGKIDLSKLNAIIFLLFKPQGNGLDKKDLCLTQDQIKEFSKFLLLESKTKFKIGCDSCMINKVSQVRQLTDSESIFVDTCEGSRMSCYISPDMMFMPCSFGNKNEYGIKIDKNNPIQKIWNEGSPFKYFRNVLKENPTSCPYEL